MNDNASLPNDGTVTITRSRYEKYQQAEIELERLQALSLAPQPDAAGLREKIARTLCQSGRFETGEGTCAALCMSQLGDPRKSGCSYCTQVHGNLADAILALLPSDAAVMREKIENIIFNRLFLAIDTAERGDLTRAAKESADAILALLPTDAAVKALVEALNELNASAGSFRSIMALKWIEMMPQEAVVRFDTARAKATATLAQHGHK